MNLSPSQHKRLSVITNILVGLTVIAVVFTLIQWIRTEPGSFEPLNALAAVILSALTAISNWLKKQTVAEEIVPAESTLPFERLNLNPLRRQINQVFNIEELRTFCLDLDVDFDSLTGKTKSAKVVSLISYMQRRQLIPHLVDALVKARPNVEWIRPTIIAVKELQLRDVILRKIKTAWIDDYLNKSLSNEIVMDLGLVRKPDAVIRTSGIVLQQSGKVDGSLTKTTSVREVYENYGRSLLILGEPGSGKTISMLQLAQEIIQESREQPSQPIPVVLNLVSWTEERQPLEKWVVEEMLAQYQVARRISRPWVENGQLLYLLDGLDEVNIKYRDDCVMAINTFLAHYPADVVVCSRIGDYEEMNQRLNLFAAFCIQPLTKDQIERYLNQGPLGLKTLNKAIVNDSNLFELAQSPLMLNIMTLAHQGLTKKELAPLKTIEGLRQHLLHHFVERAFERRPLPDGSDYDKVQALGWLSNLAQGMRQFNQPVFHVEALQPTWLPPGKYRLFKSLVGLLVGFIVGFIVGLVFGFIIGPSEGLVFGPGETLLFGVNAALVGGLGGALGNWLSATLSNKWIRFSIAVLIVGLAYGIFTSLTSDLFTVLSIALLSALGIGLSIGIIAYQSNIEVVETLHLSWTSARIFFKGLWKGFIAGLIIGLTIGLIIGIVVSQMIGAEASFGPIVLFVLIVGLIGGLFGGLIGSLISIIQTKTGAKILRANQGMQSSLNNAIRMSLLISVLTGLLGLLIIWRTNLGLDFIFSFLVFPLPTSFLYFGGAAVFHHVILRSLLTRYKILPLHLISFCDDMKDRVLLRRVGGGWVFTHRYLLEFLAQSHRTKINDQG